MAWDLSALLHSADPAASAIERHLWLVRLMDWLRQPPPEGAHSLTPWPVVRMGLLLDVLETQPEISQRVGGVVHHSLRDLDSNGLLADFGFPPRQGFVSELGDRLRLAWLPGTPQTSDAGELFSLLFNRPDDAAWVAALDEATLGRLLRWLEHSSGTPAAWRDEMVEAVQLLASQIRANGLSKALRSRIAPSHMADRPFHQVVALAEALQAAHQQGAGAEALAAHAARLRAVLGRCLDAAHSARQHLDEWGISVDVVFQMDQMRKRAQRIEQLLDAALAAEPAPAFKALWLALLSAAQDRQGIGALFTHHYALLARKVTERSAETGEHYITRDRAEYRQMLGKAAGGGAVIGLTTLAKFALTALQVSAFWVGFLAGVNYALSFVLVHLLHWTVATKQPAMTAPALAAKLEAVGQQEGAIEGFVDEVTHLIRSQIAGIVGNLALVAPVVLAAQGLAWWVQGAPLVGEKDAHYVLHSLTLLGPTALFAAFTGVLLFASSLIAGWVENWFVYHRLESALAWNPRITDLLGPSRAQRWARWWRGNISGLAANVSLGLMLGIIPALAAFVGLPLEVRHVTLGMGQLAAAVGALGLEIFQQPAFWWCLAGIGVTGLLNLAVSFTLAFRVALASRGLQVQERGRLYAALRQRWRQAPGSFFKPPV
ncbi:site-specific recombinase [Ideonella paludis]|uniref:Site-specific recombinase n=1 Tax=Ideonella paludis TaxID=1233411 RepID=A0ABS5DZI6_9BURK|nr:site-specific recombinase [Ideonella paludis]MBQ0936484.1 site-specific recombinase [Ideonella paludis]